MTAIDCPQCHEKILVSTCPHCGFSFPDADTDIDTEYGVIQEEQPLRAELGAPKRELPFGIGCTVFGVMGLIASLLLMATPLRGLALLFGSALLIIAGSAMIIGTVIADCPYCGKKMRMLPNVQKTTCTHCKTVCVRKENYLEIL